MSWIAIDDEVAAIEHALVTEALSGPVNLVSPHPVRNREFAKTLGRVLRRPAVLPTPTAPLRLVFGSQFVEEVLLASQRAVPSRLLASGYRFRFPELEPALNDVIRR
jgi:NAD dependent epimerase/dehydratase family enzyme